MDINSPEYMEYFLNFSEIVTGFSQFHLQGTGFVAIYFENIRDIIGGDLFGELLETFHRLELEAQQRNDESFLSNGLRSEILGSQKLGPIARNIIKVWYLGAWRQLPQEWWDVFGTKEKDRDFIITPQAYTEGLLWPTIGANPQAAKAPGYGTWSDPPSVSLTKS